jgi:integrase/recombinase XerD
MKTLPLAHYIRLFLTDYLPNERGLSDNTLLAYRDTLKLLLRYLDTQLERKIDQLDCQAIDAQSIRAFLDYLEKQRRCSANTRNARLAALKSFFYFLGRQRPECLDISHQVSLIALKKTPHKTVDYLEAEELNAILGSVDGHSRTGLRDKALLLFMYNTGARAQEIADLKIEHVRFDAASQVLLTGKGHKQRLCPLWPETLGALEDYLTVRTPNNSNEQHLFLNARGVKITRFGIRYIVRAYTAKSIPQCPALEKKNITPHTFRHTTAMHLLQAGNELNMVRLWLGHACLNTTHMYIEINMQMKRQILNTTKAPNLKSKHYSWQQPKILQWLDELCRGSTLCGVSG